MYTQLLDTLKNLALPDQLRYLATQYPKTTVFSTSLGQEDQVITDVIGRNQLDIRIFTLDTGRLFYETYELIDETRQRYGTAIETYFPDTAQAEKLTTEFGFHSFYDSVDARKACCHVRKVVPLQRALQGAQVWITGLRAEQSTNRAEMKQVEWDAHYQVIKVNPLIDWTYAQVTEYIRQNNVPENKLHAKGFISIGCAPCTRAIAPDEDPRAGRWWWESSKKECGLHVS